MTTTSSTTANGPPPSLVTTQKYIFFYGYELQIPELTFQQWYPSVIVEPDPSSSPSSDSTSTTRFPTAEHYMTYHKALVMGDHETAQKILLASTPAVANALGRAVRNYDSALWRRERDRVAEDGNWLKFSQIEECKRALLDSGDKILVEASPTDRVWGIGYRGDEAEGNEKDWGENVMGRALMKVRDRLRKQESEGQKL